MKKAYQRRLPTILEKKTPQREKLALLRFGIQPLSGGMRYSSSNTLTPLLGRNHKIQDGSSQRGRGKRTANG